MSARVADPGARDIVGQLVKVGCRLRTVFSIGRWQPSPLEDVSQAGYVVERLRAFEGRAQDLVPGPFDAYARVFHRPDQGMPDEDGTTSWQVVADRRGTVLHP